MRRTILQVFAAFLGFTCLAEPRDAMNAAHQTENAAIDEQPYDAEVEFLSGDGASWFDTGMAMPPNATYVVYATRNVSTVPPYETVCGCRIASFSCDFQVTLYLGNLLVRNGQHASQYGQAEKNPEVEIFVDPNKDLYVNGEFRKNVGGDLYSDLPIYVMALNQEGDAIQICTGNVSFHGMKVWDANGVLVLDLIPVRVGEGECVEGCLYNRVGRRLLFNLGTGSCPVGPDKE